VALTLASWRLGAVVGLPSRNVLQATEFGRRSRRDFYGAIGAKMAPLGWFGQRAGAEPLILAGPGQVALLLLGLADSVGV
jgi:hypothetical protein